MSDLTYLETTRASYDSVAAHYSGLFLDELADEPVKRSQLTLFAELATGPVADVGCGPGQVTAFLRGRGLDVFGVDLSPGMVEQARRNHPGLRFEVGSMTGLARPDGSLGGLNAWYSTIHIPDRQFPAVIAEFHRVLAPGAPLMLAFQVGDDPKHFTEAWDREVDLTLYRRRPAAVAATLTGAGFQMLTTTVHDRDPGEPGREAAYLLARRTP